VCQRWTLLIVAVLHTDMGEARFQPKLRERSIVGRSVGKRLRAQSSFKGQRTPAYSFKSQ